MRLKALALSTTAIMLGWSGSALAQATEPAASGPEATANQGPPDAAAPQTPETAPGEEAGDTGEDIVVTGIRASLASSQNIKRNAPQVVDAVVAQDIGKLPDLAVSDTAARIPGVQVYRQGGEAARVLVRGLPFFGTTYNGREIFTAETRVVALQDFPSANIAALEVFKTSTAELVEPGLAGLVNVRSRRPFDFDDGQVAGSVWGLYTREADKLTPNFNLLATKRWDTGIGEVGLLINGSYTELQYLDSEPSNTDFIADPTINNQRVRLPDIQRLFYRSGNRARPSVNAAAQWRPTPDLELYGEILWQGFRNKIDDRLLEAPLYGGSSYSNIVFRDGTNLIDSGTVVGRPNSLFTFQGGTYNRTNTFQYAGGFKYDAGPLKLTGDLARTISTFRGSTESLDRVFQGTPTIDFDLTTPQFRVNGVNGLNPANFLFQGLFEQNQRSKGADWQGRLDAQYDFDSSFLKSIQVGGRYTRRRSIRELGERYAFLLPLGINAATLPVEFDIFRGGFRSTDVQPTRTFTSPTYDSIRNNLTELRQFVINACPRIIGSDPANGCRNYTLDPVVAALQYRARESTLTGYAQINYGFGEDLDGSIGIRAVRTKVRVGGAVPTGIAAIDEGQEFTDWLPNASLRYRITPELQARLSATQTRTRPNFSDLNPAITLGPPPSGGVGTDSNPRRGGGGNPFLQSFKSDNYDASLEYYFAKAGFGAVTVFRRELDGFIQQREFRFTDPTLGVVAITGPVNTGKGRITGVEGQFQAFADLDGLPDWARGFGVQANVTYLDAKTQQTDGTATGLVYARIFFDDGIRNGVSKWNYNLTGLYEANGLSARLTYNGRSDFLAFRTFRGGSLAQPNPGDLYLEEGSPPDRLDLSLNYDVIPAATVFFDWTNITRSPFKQYFSSARDGAPRAEFIRYRRYDEATLSLGVRFRFGR